MRVIEQLTRGLLPATVATGAIAAALLALWVGGLPGEQHAAARAVDHTLEVLGVTSTLDADLATLSSEGRGFIVDRTSDSRARFEAAAGRITADVATLHAMMDDTPAEDATLNWLQPLIDARIAHLHSVIDLLSHDDEAGALALVTSHEGRVVADHLVMASDAIKSEERRLLGQRLAAAQSAARKTAWAVFGGVLVVAGSAAATLALVVRRRQSRRQAGQLAAINATLERRVAERTDALAASMAEKQSYFDRAPVGLIVMRATDNGGWLFEDLNPAAEQIYRCKRQDVIGLALQTLCPPGVTPSVAQSLDRCASTGESLNTEISWQGSDGPTHLDVDLACLVDPAGQARRVLLCVRDLTEQRRLELQVLTHSQRQAASAQRELALFRNSPDILFIARVEECDGLPGFVYESFSPALQTLTGLTASDLVGCRLEDCLPPDLAETAIEECQRCVDEKTMVSYETSYAGPVGLKEFEVSVTPILDQETGRVTHLVGSARDVTERNRMRAALQQAQRFEAIGKLAAGVAHDFNNILQSVIGGLELILDETPRYTAPYRYGSLALNAALRGSTLTNHLLSYARKQMLVPCDIALGAFVAEMQQVLAGTLGPHITVVAHCDPAVDHVVADRTQLETALINLAINAADAMPAGGALSLKARDEWEADRHWVVFAMVDTGCGMDAATLASAVEPFFTTKGSKGTGLGLSMVHGFAEQSGGRLSLRSTIGLGTTVELSLPAIHSRDIMPAPLAPGDSARGIRVLLVDDNSDVLVTVGAFMDRAGVTITRAACGDAALAALGEGGRFDALVTDYAMPGLNGADLIEMARDVQPGLPAVIITGFVDLALYGAMPAGTVILHKPFERQALLGAIDAVMGRDWDDLDNLAQQNTGLRGV